MLSWNSLYSGSNNSRLYPHILCLKKSGNDNSGSCSPLCYIEQMCRNRMFSQPNWRHSKIFIDKQRLLVIQNGLPFLPRKFKTSFRKTVKHSEIFRNIVPDIFVRSCIGLMLVMAVNAAVVKAPSCKSVSLMDYIKLFYFVRLNYWNISDGSPTSFPFYSCSHWRKFAFLGGMENNWPCIYWQDLQWSKLV